MYKVRTFDTGASRDTDDRKYDYEGTLSPLVLKRYAKYIHEHRKMADGSMRDAANWQNGIPLEAYMKSAYRHFIDWHTMHDGYVATDFDGNNVEQMEAICGVIFNAMGYLHELLKPWDTNATWPEVLRKELDETD